MILYYIHKKILSQALRITWESVNIYKTVVKTMVCAKVTFNYQPPKNTGREWSEFIIT